MTDKMEIVSERLFADDQQTLFDAFANPRSLAQWWGPHGFTNEITEFDLRAGGDWRVTMTASDGGNFHNHSTFEVVEAPHRIVFIHHLPVHIYRMEMTFKPEAGATRLRWHMLFEPTDENLMLKKFIAAANEQNFERLEAFLAASGPQ